MLIFYKIALFMETNHKNDKLISARDKLEPGKFACSKRDDVLCKLCGRTLENGIRCLGMCVAESDY